MPCILSKRVEKLMLSVHRRRGEKVNVVGTRYPLYKRSLPYNSGFKLVNYIYVAFQTGRDSPSLGIDFNTFFIILT